MVWTRHGAAVGGEGDVLSGGAPAALASCGARDARGVAVAAVRRWVTSNTLSRRSGRMDSCSVDGTRRIRSETRRTCCTYRADVLAKASRSHATLACESSACVGLRDWS